LNALVAQVGPQKPDVVIAITSPAVLALKEGRLTIPVVFAFVPDPIGLGVVESLAQPGGNFTGVTYSESALGGKRFELLLDAILGTTKIAVLWNPSFPGHADALESIRTSASTRGIGVFSRELFQRQYARKPARCQRITVSGLTIFKASSTPGAPDTTRQIPDGRCW
jgi:putative ABC transport system substrate-binding protein